MVGPLWGWESGCGGEEGKKGGCEEENLGGGGLHGRLLGESVMNNGGGVISVERVCGSGVGFLCCGGE